MSLDATAQLFQASICVCHPRAIASSRRSLKVTRRSLKIGLNARP